MNKLHKYEISGFFGILLLFLIYEFSNFIFNLNNLKNFIDSFGLFGPLIFVLISVLMILLTFPMSFILIFSGIVFGAIEGFFLSFLILTISSLIAFNLSRGFSKKFKKESKKQKSTYISRIVEKIDKNVIKHPILSVFLPVIFFLPFIEISYASGLVKNLKLKSFFIAILFANIIQTVVFIFIGDSITKNFKIFLIGIGIFILFLLIPRIFKIIHPKLHSNFYSKN